MTKKVDTDPDLDGMLAELAKPKPLDHKEKLASSAGTDAAEYHAQPRVPPQRADHNTFPNAPVIVHQTQPGIAPPANPLNVTPEERKRLEEELELRRKAREHNEREAETAPRRTDPPGVTSDPPRTNAVSKSLVALVLLAIVTAIVIGIAMRTKTTSSTVSSSTTATKTQATTPIASTTATVTTTAETTATTTQTIHVITTSTTVTTATHPTATHTNMVAPTATTTTTTTAATTTSAPPDIRGTN